MTTVANILTNVGYRLFTDGSTITTTSEPSQAECIQWINETEEELLTVCVEMGSELGRTLGSISTSNGVADYYDLPSIFAPAIYYDNHGDHFSGWILKTNERIPITLVSEQESINYDPALTKEPESFYIDGANTITFLPIPDASYTVKIPYYGYLTSHTTTTSTIAFMRVFDHVITESVVMRAQNREEYELGFELKWFQHLRNQARKIIMMRKKPKTKITL